MTSVRGWPEETPGGRGGASHRRGVSRETPGSCSSKILCRPVRVYLQLPRKAAPPHLCTPLCLLNNYHHHRLPNPVVPVLPSPRTPPPLPRPLPRRLRPAGPQAKTHRRQT